MFETELANAERVYQGLLQEEAHATERLKDVQQRRLMAHGAIEAVRALADSDTARHAQAALDAAADAEAARAKRAGRTPRQKTA